MATCAYCGRGRAEYPVAGLEAHKGCIKEHDGADPRGVAGSHAREVADAAELSAQRAAAAAQAKAIAAEHRRVTNAARAKVVRRNTFIGLGVLAAMACVGGIALATTERHPAKTAPVAPKTAAPTDPKTLPDARPKAPPKAPAVMK